MGQPERQQLRIEAESLRIGIRNRGEMLETRERDPLSIDHQLAGVCSADADHEHDLHVDILLVHAVLLAQERGELGVTLFAALAVACAGSDVGAFIVGRRFGRHPLAPRLSPNKTREGVIGNVLGAAVGFLPFLVLLQPWFEPQAIVVLVLLVAVGSLWGDLLESAIKREAGVKDAAQWLPGFGGILDRIDSLLLVVPLVYWAMRVADVAR